MYCSDCGHEVVSDSAKFCSECGAKVYRSEVEEPQPESPATLPTTVPNEKPSSTALDNDSRPLLNETVKPDVPLQPPANKLTAKPDNANSGATLGSRMNPQAYAEKRLESETGATTETTRRDEHVAQTAGEIVTTHDEILDQLEKYIGPNWKSHYHKTFSRLLKEKLGEEKHAGNVWNWSAFFAGGFWCLNRRLWGGFFATWFAVTIFNVTGLLILQPVILILLGAVGDRMLFKKAYKKVLSDLAKKTTASQ